MCGGLRGASRQQQAAGLLRAARVPGLLRKMPLWHGVLTLCYHRIGDAAASPLDPQLFSATAEAFDEQLEALVRHCDLVLPDEVPDALRTPRGRFVLLTFDDGYRDNVEVALPLLRRHRARAAFYLATGFLDRPRLSWWDEAAWLTRHDRRALEPALATIKAGTAPDVELDRLASATGQVRPSTAEADGVWMTWDMARSLRDAGMAVGGHTVNHPVLAHLDVDQQRAEIDGCAARLRDELGVPMRSFCYPVGLPDSYDARTRGLLAEAGCETAFSFHGGHARAGRRLDLLDLPRAAVGPWSTADTLLAATLVPSRFARY